MAMKMVTDYYHLCSLGLYVLFVLVGMKSFELDIIDARILARSQRNLPSHLQQKYRFRGRYEKYR